MCAGQITRVGGDKLIHRHINNVTYARYIESARMRWVETLESDLGKEAKDDLVAGRGLGIILKEQTIRFRYPVTYPDSVSVSPPLLSTSFLSYRCLSSSEWLTADHVGVPTALY